MTHELKFQVGQLVKIISDEYHEGFAKTGAGIGSTRTIEVAVKESREGYERNFQEYRVSPDDTGTYRWYAETDLERVMKFKVGDEVRITSCGPVLGVSRCRIGDVLTIVGVEPESCTGDKPCDYQEYKLTGDLWAAECGLELVNPCAEIAMDVLPEEVPEVVEFHTLKFKVGDEVEIVKNSYGSTNRVGDVYVIEEAVLESRKGTRPRDHQEYRLKDVDDSLNWVTEADIKAAGPVAAEVLEAGKLYTLVSIGRGDAYYPGTSYIGRVFEITDSYPKDSGYHFAQVKHRPDCDGTDPKRGVSCFAYAKFVEFTGPVVTPVVGAEYILSAMGDADAFHGHKEDFLGAKVSVIDMPLDPTKGRKVGYTGAYLKPVDGTFPGLSGYQPSCFFEVQLTPVV